MAKIQKRITKLDKIFKGIYEDGMTGSISHERFLNRSAEYNVEQEGLQKQTDEFQKEKAELDRRQIDFCQFREIVRKYVGITELTLAIINEFVKKIKVHIHVKSRDTGYKRYKSFLTSSVNLSHRTSLFPVKRKFRRIVSNSEGNTSLSSIFFDTNIFVVMGKDRLRKYFLFGIMFLESGECA